MKKIKIFLTLMLIFLVTGCSNYNMTMKIGKDKSMEYSLIILSDYYNSNLVDSISIYKEKYEKYGYLVEEYNVESKYGMIISKKFDNIDDISYAKPNDEFNLLYLYNDDNIEVENQMFSVDKGFITNKYTANFYVDLSNLEIDLDNVTVSYNVELPNESLTNNANFISEDKKTLTWNITSIEKIEIDYEFELNSYDKIYYIIAILILIYLFFSILNKLFMKNEDSGDIVRFKNDNLQNNNSENLNNGINNHNITNNNQLDVKVESNLETNSGVIATNNVVNNNNDNQTVSDNVNFNEINNNFNSKLIDVPIIYSEATNSNTDNNLDLNVVNNSNEVSHNSSGDDGPVIKVNSKSVVINNDNKEDE